MTTKSAKKALGVGVCPTMQLFGTAHEPLQSHSNILSHLVDRSTHLHLSSRLGKSSGHSELLVTICFAGIL